MIEDIKLYIKECPNCDNYKKYKQLMNISLFKNFKNAKLFDLWRRFYQRTRRQFYTDKLAKEIFFYR